MVNVGQKLTKRWSHCIHDNSGAILLFWLLLTLLIVLLLSFALVDVPEQETTQVTLNYANATLSEETTITKKVTRRHLVGPSALLYSLLLSLLPVICISRGNASVSAVCISSFHFVSLSLLASHFLFQQKFPSSLPISLAILLVTSVGNVVSFRVSWKKCRKGPSEAPLPRLLENCLIGASHVLFPTVTATIFLTLSACLFKSDNLTLFAVSASLATLQHLMFVVSALPAFLLFRQSGTFSLPCGVPCSRVLTAVKHCILRAFLFTYRTTVTFVSKLKHFLVLLFMIQTVVSGCFIYIDFLLGLETSDFLVLIGVSQNETVTEDLDVVSIRLTATLSFLSLIITLVFTCNVLLTVLSVITVLNVVVTTKIILRALAIVDTDFIHLITVLTFVLPMDAMLRYAMSYKECRRGKRVTRVVGAFDSVIVPICVSATALFTFSMALYGFTNEKAFLSIGFCALWNFLLILFFSTPALVLAGPLTRSFCCCEKPSPSVLNSECTDNRIMCGEPASRKSSTTHYSALYKKRNSMSVTPTVRRASMPVIVNMNTKTPRQWMEYGGKRGMSIDVVSVGSTGQRVILRREPLQTSQPSLKSQQSEVEDEKK